MSGYRFYSNLRDLGDFFFPVNCSSCHSAPSSSLTLCPNCLESVHQKLLSESVQRCHLCSRHIASGSTCFSCSSILNQPAPFIVHSLFSYQNEIRRLILDYKMKENFNLKRFFAYLLATSQFLKNAQQAGFIIVPTPSRQTSFGAMLLIARELKNFYGIPFSSVLKTHARKSQKTLNRKERLENLKNKIIFSGRRIEKALLIDDILTTGATMRECIKVLRKNGSSEIRVLALASVPEEISTQTDQPVH